MPFPWVPQNESVLFHEEWYLNPWSCFNSGLFTVSHAMADYSKLCRFKFTCYITVGFLQCFMVWTVWGCWTGIAAGQSGWRNVKTDITNYLSFSWRMFMGLIVVGLILTLVECRFISVNCLLPSSLCLQWYCLVGCPQDCNPSVTRTIPDKCHFIKRARGRGLCASLN